MPYFLLQAKVSIPIRCDQKLPALRTQRSAAPFQFRYGAIKSQENDPEGKFLARFNSDTVRSKAWLEGGSRAYAPSFNSDTVRSKGFGRKGGKASCCSFNSDTVRSKDVANILIFGEIAKFLWF